MPGQLIELASSPTYGEDAGKHKTGRKTWHFRGDSVEAAAAEFQSDATYRVWPTDERLIFDSMNASRNASGAGCTVTADFSSFKASRFSALPNRDVPGYRGYTWTSRDVEVGIPASVRERRLVRLPNDGEEVLLVWAGHMTKVLEVRSVYILRYRVGALGFGEFDGITRQRNKIHSLFGLKLQFVNGSVSEGDGTYFDVTYTWERDDGTARPNIPAPVPPAQPMYQIRDPSNRVPDNRLIRLPYEVLVPIASEDPKTTPHGCEAIKPYEEEPNGWQELPGVVP